MQNFLDACWVDACWVKDEENMVWSGSKVLIAVAVVASVAVVVSVIISPHHLFHRYLSHSLSFPLLFAVAVALILLPVDPIDDVLMALM